MEIKHETFDFIIAELELVNEMFEGCNGITDLVANLSSEEIARIWGLAEVCGRLNENFGRICKHQ
jgi:hypothetical protein